MPELSTTQPSAAAHPTDTIAIGAGLDFTAAESPWRRYYLTPDQAAAITFLGMLFLFMNFVPLWHTDTWGHIQYGQWIAEHGRLPDGNPFCPLLKQEVPTNHYSWLSQYIFYEIYSLGEFLAGGDADTQLRGGVDLLRLTLALVVTLRLSLLLIVFQRLTGSLRLALLGLGIMVVFYTGNLAIFRPQIVGELAFACLLLPLSRPALSRAALLGIPALLILWANLHGSYAIGLVLLALFLAGRCLDILLQNRSCNPRILFADIQVRRLTLALFSAVLGIAVLNPAGPWIYARTIAMTQHPVVLAMDEWQPLTFAWKSGGHWTYLATLLLLAASLLYGRRWPKPSALLLLFFFISQPLLHQRALVWWLIFWPWLVLPLWICRTDARLARWARTVTEPSLRKTVIAAMIVVVFFLWSIPGQWLLAGQPTPLERSLSSGTPWQLALELQGRPAGDTAWSPELQTWLHKHYAQGRYQGRLFTTETSGDYLLWSLPEDNTVFMYSHVHLFPPEHWQLVAAVRYGSPHWRKVLDHFKINVVVVEAELNARLAQLLHEDAQWLVVRDETGDRSKYDYRCRLLVAVRKQPLR